MLGQTAERGRPFKFKTAKAVVFSPEKKPDGSCASVIVMPETVNGHLVGRVIGATVSYLPLKSA